jgi:hypothetical protein
VDVTRRFCGRFQQPCGFRLIASLTRGIAWLRLFAIIGCLLSTVGSDLSAQILGPGLSYRREKRDTANLNRSDGVWPQLASFAEALNDDKLERAADDLDWEALNGLKHQFTLFNPTPKRLRREFLTDRPDKTLTPVTVDAGHVQFETDFVSYKFNREQQPQEQNATDRNFYAFMLTNVRIGVLNNLDVHVILQPFDFIGATAPRLPQYPGSTAAFGFGDMSVMFKHNLWGNDGGPTALGWAGRIDIPSGSPRVTSGFVEGGTSLFWLRRWPNKLYLGIEAGVDIRENIRQFGYHTEFLNSISLAYSLTKKLGSKVEIASIASTESRQPWEGVFATALLFQPLEDMQLDIGMNVGLTKPAMDFNPYSGVSVRW